MSQDPHLKLAHAAAPRASSGRRLQRRRRGQRAPAQVDAGVTHEAAGVILFKHIFRIAPQALPLFSFGRVAGAEVNDALFAQEALKAHATKVVATVATRARKSNFRRPRGPRHRRTLAHRSRRPSGC
jgi:hypothetical protein